jgi:hypothetical protein
MGQRSHEDFVSRTAPNTVSDKLPSMQIFNAVEILLNSSVLTQNDRYRSAKDFMWHYHAKGQYQFGPREDKASGSIAIEKEFQYESTSRTWAETTGDGKDSALQVLSTEGMMAVNDLSRLWVDAAPEAEL